MIKRSENSTIKTDFSSKLLVQVEVMRVLKLKLIDSWPPFRHAVWTPNRIRTERHSSHCSAFQKNCTKNHSVLDFDVRYFIKFESSWKILKLLGTRL